jgi:hypothetical protein
MRLRGRRGQLGGGGADAAVAVPSQLQEGISNKQQQSVWKKKPGTTWLLVIMRSTVLLGVLCTVARSKNGVTGAAGQVLPPSSPPPPPWWWWFHSPNAGMRLRLVAFGLAHCGCKTPHPGVRRRSPLSY